MAIKIITAICLIGMIIEVVAVIVNILIKNREERILFIRSFKKGKCAIIFIFACPLLIMAGIYKGYEVFNAIMTGIEKTFGLVVLKYDNGLLEPLMNAMPLYKFTIYFTYILVGLNAVMFTISLTNQSIWRFFHSLKERFSTKSRLYIFGNNDGNKDIYSSDNNHIKTIIDDLNKDDCYKLYLKKIVYSPCKDNMLYVDKIFKKNIDRENIIIVNTLDDEQNILICKRVIENINNVQKELKKKLFLNLKVFVFGNPDDEAIYSDIVNKGYGCIHYINKYQKIAIDFINNYPLTRFMDEKQIDYSTSLVKNDVEINMCLIGFGKTNRQLFLTSVANNQFITKDNGQLKLKKVTYHIFDKEEAENNKNLNHNYYRYKNEVNMSDKDKYLPLPEMPAREEFYHLDINDTEFYNTIKNISTRNSNDVNFVVIAFGTDLENMDMAQKLVEKRREWNIENLVIFVKIRHWKKAQTLIYDNNCYFIGNEKVVYDIDEITGNTLYKMAKMRNEIYDLEYNIGKDGLTKVTKDYIDDKRMDSEENWYKGKSEMERESSIYGCLSLRSKLNMMGLDYCKKDCDIDSLTEREYLDKYAHDDLPDRESVKVKAGDKVIVHYSLDFKDSRRKNMAVQEHYRWNSFMLSKGTIPATIDKILTETKMVKKVIDGEEKDVEKFTNGRNYALRRHGNLTTFDGLVTFRKMVAERDKVTEEEMDVIKYDYQILDDAYWLLDKNGFKIISR